jgi:hypothetical protein
MDSHSNVPYTKLLKLLANGRNWVLWKAEVTSAIRAEGLVRYLKGHAKEPTAPVNPGSGTTLSDTAMYKKAVETHKESYNLWVQKNEKIKTVFYQTVPVSKKLTIMQAVSAAEAWKALCKEHKNHGAISQINILDQINALQTANGGTLATHSIAWRN